MNTIFGSIVTYNPNIHRLECNIESAIRQVDTLIIVDNNSINKEEIYALREKYNVITIFNDENSGLSGALNDAFEYANGQDADWVVVLDQDSILPKDYVEKAKRYFKDDTIGIITCGYVEKNLDSQIGFLNLSKPWIYINRCITSGSVVNVKAYNSVRGGYDNVLFVDYVDFDFSVKIRQAGYKILYMNDVTLSHELGDSKWVRFLFWKLRYTAHSSKREYLIARNITIYINRYRKSENVTRDLLSLIKHYVFIALYDDDRREKIKALNNGRRDAKKYIKER